MSYAQRFMQKKEAVSDAEGWQQVGGGSLKAPLAPIGASTIGAERGGGQRRWDNEERGSFPSAFSKPRREERPAYQKQWSAPQPPKQKEVNLDSTEDFPSLGGVKPKAAVSAASPPTSGWASKAASWAAADEAEAAAERRRQAEAEQAEKERRRQAAGIPELLGNILRRRGEDSYRANFQEPMDDDYDGRPRSPPYDPDYELAEYAAAAGNYQLHSGGNSHLEPDDEDDGGWNESR